MFQVIVSVKDTAAQAFGRPVFVPAVPVAVRSFRDEVNRKDSDQDLSKYPDDFELYELGSFDDSTGIIQLLDAPRMVARAKDLKESV
ncbi:DNA binding protein vP5 [Microviridae sp.]|nr:DNA binding protein vP5 [Microviridae sp.]